MKKIKLGLLAAASACLLAALPAQANLVVNGDFETGTFPPWVPDNAVITAVPANVHSGSFAAQLLPASSSITQPVPIVGGVTYSLDFWAKADGAGTMLVTLDGVLATAIINPPASYTHYSMLVTPLGTGDIRFNWADLLTNSGFIDDVNLVAVPEPTTMIAGAMLLLPFGASTLRVIRKRRVT